MRAAASGRAVIIYFNNLAKDSLPTIEAEVEISQIVLKPDISQQEKERVKNKLKSFKERLQNGEDFKVLAQIVYINWRSARWHYTRLPGAFLINVYA